MQGEQAIWDNLLTWLSTTTSKPAVQESAVALLAVIADRGLAPNLQLHSPQLWSLPVLQQGPLAAASMHLVCAAFAQGVHTSLKLICQYHCGQRLHTCHRLAYIVSLPFAVKALQSTTH